MMIVAVLSHLRVLLFAMTIGLRKNVCNVFAFQEVMSS